MSASEAVSSKRVLCWKGSCEINAIKLRPADCGNLDIRRVGRGQKLQQLAVVTMKLLMFVIDLQDYKIET